MKQLMIDMMTAAMPYMRPLVYAAGVIAIAGLVLALVGSGSRLARLAGGLVVAVGCILIACEVAGRVLGFEPTLLFAAPADRVPYRNQWPFWTVGGVAVLVGMIVRSLAARRSR